MKPSSPVIVLGKRLEVAWYATPAESRPTIVMLHEALGSVALWRKFPLRLAQRTGCGVVAYSRAGHGASESPNGPRATHYLHEEAQVVLPRLLQSLGIVRPVLFGHSDGASIAIICAGTISDLPAALVLEAPHVFVEDRTIAGVSQARRAFGETDWAARLGRYHNDAVSTFRAWSEVWLDPAFRSWNIEAYLSRVRCPVLVVQGEDDAYGTQAQLEAIARRVHDCELITLPGCGHAPHDACEPQILDLVARFIARACAARA